MKKLAAMRKLFPQKWREPKLSTAGAACALAGVALALLAARVVVWFRTSGYELYKAKVRGLIR